MVCLCSKGYYYICPALLSWRFLGFSIGKLLAATSMSCDLLGPREDMDSEFVSGLGANIIDFEA